MEAKEEELLVSNSLADSSFVNVKGSVWHAGRLSTQALSHSLPLSKSSIFSPEIKIVSISSGALHFCALDYWGRCFSWGDNSLNQCGIPKESTRFVSHPHFLHNETNFKQIYCGSNHCGNKVYLWVHVEKLIPKLTVSLDECGQVFMWGRFDSQREEQFELSKIFLGGKRANFVCATLKGTVVVCEEEIISFGVPSIVFEKQTLSEIVGVASAMKFLFFIMSTFPLFNLPSF